jgi:hypothetical protein
VQRAASCYRFWGALRKLDMIKSRYANVLDLRDLGSSKSGLSIRPSSSSRAALTQQRKLLQTTNATETMDPSSVRQWPNRTQDTTDGFSLQPVHEDEFSDFSTQSSSSYSVSSVSSSGSGGAPSLPSPTSQPEFLTSGGSGSQSHQRRTSSTNPSGKSRTPSIGGSRERQRSPPRSDRAGGFNDKLDRESILGSARLISREMNLDRSLATLLNILLAYSGISTRTHNI